MLKFKLKKSKLKKFLALSLSFISIISFAVSDSSFISYADDDTTTSTTTTETTANLVDEETLLKQKASFVPFRSDYVKYISQNASEDSDILQYVWLKLFKEETTTSGWSNTYYCDFTDATGVTQSSKGIQATYNTTFDAFLYQTIINNEDFVINWLNSIPTVFDTYAKSASSHDIFAQAIIELTANEGTGYGLYLGSGYNAMNNTFLAGSSSTASEKGNAAWSATATSSSTYDIAILRIFGSNYQLLNDNQKAWVKTYIPWLVNDYISNGSNAVASLNNSKDLYVLMATSGYGMASSKGQEFFNYCISTTDVFVGELIENAAEYYGVSSTLRTDDVAENCTDMAPIWYADADCDYTSSSLGDGDYDWLAYNICFNTNSYYTRLRTLVSANETTYNQMLDWLKRYYLKHPSSSGGNEVALAVARAGQTYSIYEDNGIYINACNTECRVAGVDASFWCNGHYNYGNISITKPLGVQSISFYGGCSNPSVSVSYSYTITDTTTGATIASSGGYTSNGTITFPTKYIWSSNVLITATVRLKNGYGDPDTGSSVHVGDGECWGTSHTGTYGYCGVNATYANVDYCITHDHSYAISSYTWNEDHTACTAVMQCVNCGETYSVTDATITVTEYSDRYTYTADFSSTSVPAKTATVMKGSGTVTFTASSMSGKTSGTGSGTCSLPAGNILLGAKSISVTATAGKIAIKLVNKYGAVIGTRSFSSSNYNYASTAVFDLSELSDTELTDGAYIVIAMYTSSPVYNSKDVYIGQVAGPYSFNSIVVTY